MRKLWKNEVETDPRILKLYEAVHVLPNDSHEYKADADRMIQIATELSSGAREVLESAFENGPLESGDLVSKAGREECEAKGLMIQVVVKGEDSFNACTHLGAWVVRLFKTGEFDSGKEYISEHVDGNG